MATSGPRPQDPAGSGVSSAFWAVLPLLTCGLGTPFVFLYAALRTRRRSHILAAIGYGIATVAMFGTAGATLDSSVAGGVVGALAATLVFGGTMHAFWIRRAVFGTTSRNRPDPTVATLLTRRQRREETRALADRDPGLARELCVGRPDLPRQYDDGGLVDVNSAPPAVLASLPGMTPQLVERVVDVRASHGGFTSAEELALAADLPPQLTAEIADHSVYLP